MSFETLKVNELRKIAEDFGVDLPEMLKNKQDLISHLVEEGVTWEVYQKTIKDVEEQSEELSQEVLPKFDPKAEQPKDSVLVKMDRPNFRYDVMGFTFTKEHPYVAMNEKLAQAIFDKEEGFRLATPREVQEFYN